MTQAAVAASDAIFDIEKNAQFALQLFNAYYRTPDPSGEIYATFPEFFLVKPGVIEAIGLAVHSREKKLLTECQMKAQTRNGLVGVSKYFDEKLNCHGIKLSPYPFMLGDVIDEKKAEFTFLLKKFVEFTQVNPNLYGDLTASGETDEEIALMLEDVNKCGLCLSEKLTHYSESQLLSYHPNWPIEEVKKLLASLEKEDYTWKQLFLEHLRFMMRKRSGLPAVKKISENHLVSDKMESVLLHHIPAPASDSNVDPVEVTQKLPVRNMSASPQSFVDAQESVDVMERALKVAKMKADTAALALRAEQEKIRWEALEVVALRQQMAAAELAGEAAKARIEQSRLARVAEEAEAQKHEEACLAHEQSAILAARQRIELAEAAKLEAEQRLALEVKLAKLEQQSVEQERELKICANNRIAALEQAALVMQERIHSERQATQQAEAEMAIEQHALPDSQGDMPHLVSVQQAETHADGFVYGSQPDDDDRLLAEKQHEFHASSERGELLANHANLWVSTANFIQSSGSVDPLSLVKQNTHRTSDSSVAAQASDITVFDEEHRDFERAFGINDGTVSSQTTAKRGYLQLNLFRFAQSAGFNSLLRMIGWSSSILVFAYFMLAFFRPDAGFSLGKPVAAVTKYASPEVNVSHSSVVQVLPYNSSSYIPFADLKMTDHLQFLPE